MVIERSTKKTATGKKTSLGEMYSLIEKKAYELYKKRGHGHGNDLGDWYEAEKTVKASPKKK
ncbi:MAG: DUF2934 domain-containing protein [Candidatus Omnitrophota bacterium]